MALAVVVRVGAMPSCHCTLDGHTTARPPVESCDWISVTDHAPVDGGLANVHVTVAAFSVAVCTAPDVAVSVGLFALGLAATSLVVQVVTGHSVSWSRTNIVVAIVFVAWEFFYFGYSWAASGRSFGMAVLGIRVVRADGRAIEPRQGVVRALVFPLSFLLCGLGFLGIIVQREHRALHDLIAGTAVIYAWDARAARLRFLAREAEVGAAGSSRREDGNEGGGDDGAAS